MALLIALAALQSWSPVERIDPWFDGGRIIMAVHVADDGDSIAIVCQTATRSARVYISWSEGHNWGAGRKVAVTSRIEGSPARTHEWTADGGPREGRGLSIDTTPEWIRGLAESRTFVADTGEEMFHVEYDAPAGAVAAVAEACTEEE